MNQTQQVVGLNVWGWLMMLVSVGSITLLTIWCFVRVLRAPEEVDRLSAPLEIDTHDRED